MGPTNLITLTITLTKDEYQKLVKLANFRSKDSKRVITVEQCIKDFVNSCGPIEGHWSKRKAIKQ